MNKIVAVLPSRYASTRFPGKPLALIHNKPMIQWVYERVKKMKKIDEVYVATDDERIMECVSSFGGKAIMTPSDLPSGTDRIAYAVKEIKTDFDLVLNIQGDEPMIKEEMIDTLISAFEDEAVSFATLCKRIEDEQEINNPNIAKVVKTTDNFAVYFSRSTIPFNRDNHAETDYFKHIGVYGYKPSFLKEFASLNQSYLETMEQLEQLRAIENNLPIKILETPFQSIGVDLPEHIAVVENELKSELI